MRSYFNAIPASLEESAMIDGCTRFQAMRRVTLPLALPGLVSVGVFSFNHAWNEFLFALVFTSSETNKVLSVGLATWIGQDNIYSRSEEHTSELQSLMRLSYAVFCLQNIQ